MLLLWIGTALAAPCPELASVVDGGWDAFYDAEIDAAKEASATAHQALECLEQVAPIDALLDLYRLDALIALSEGDQRSAVYATIRAVTVSPDTSPPADLGPELSDLHETWADRLAGSRARVRVEGGGTLWVDGRAATASAPLTVVEGEHLVQLDGPEGWTSGIRDISSDLVIETGLPTSEPTAASVPSEPAAASVPSEPAAASVPTEPAAASVPTEPAAASVPAEPVELPLAVPQPSPELPPEPLAADEPTSSELVDMAGILGSLLEPSHEDPWADEGTDDPDPTPQDATAGDPGTPAEDTSPEQPDAPADTGDDVPAPLPDFDALAGTTPLPLEAPGPTVSPELRSQRTLRRIGMLSGGSVAAVLGGATLAVASRQEGEFRDDPYTRSSYGGCAESDDCWSAAREAEIRSDAARIRRLYATGYLLTGLGLGAIGADLIFLPSPDGASLLFQGRW